MPKYDYTLEKLLDKVEDIRKLDFIFDVSRQLINCLQVVHKAGYVYNDLKPDNVMISFDANSQMKVSLIDYNLATKRPSSNQKEPGNARFFNGSFIFASLDQLNFFETSPRDDLEALFHMMLVLLNGVRLVG